MRRTRPRSGRLAPVLLLGAALGSMAAGCGTQVPAGSGQPATVAAVAGARPTPAAAGPVAGAALPAADGGARADRAGLGASAGGEAPMPTGGAGGSPLERTVAGSTGGSGVAGSSGAAAASGAAAPAAGSSGAAAASGAAAQGGTRAASVILGADISSLPEHSYSFVDTDGETKSLLELLKNHGFNYIRVRTFVDPRAPHGYASTANGCAGLPEAFGDRDHVVLFGKQIKAAGMGFLLDFHYSDVWADPGKQHIPAAWRDARSIEELASRLKAYTQDVLRNAIAAGARPDMVQIGNEITPGVLMHVPGPNTDCWGNRPVAAPIGGSAANWSRFAALLRAGIKATREVDSSIRIMLHIENTDDRAGALAWVDNAVQQQLDFDVLGLSCYTAFQGAPAVWAATFKALASAHPKLQFVIAEYNPERTRANLIMRELPDGRGLGTFFWEPTRSGEWGAALFSEQSGQWIANKADFAEFDALRPMLGL